jgi:hypothetical protein
MAGDEEGKGNKAMAMAARIEGEWTATVTNRAMVTMTKRMMATVTMVAGDEEGNGDGGKSNGDGNEGGGQANWHSTDKS